MGTGCFFVLLRRFISFTRKFYHAKCVAKNGAGGGGGVFFYRGLVNYKFGFVFLKLPKLEQ
jgi:hypothetical protein